MSETPDTLCTNGDCLHSGKCTTGRCDVLTDRHGDVVDVFPKSATPPVQPVACEHDPNFYCACDRAKTACPRDATPPAQAVAETDAAPTIEREYSSDRGYEPAAPPPREGETAARAAISKSPTSDKGATP